MFGLGKPRQHCPTTERFVFVCQVGPANTWAGNVNELKDLYDEDPGLINKQNGWGQTGLMAALQFKQHSVYWT